MKERLTVLFPITDLAMDGAQRQLLELVKGLDKDRFRPIVPTFHPGGPLEREFKAIPGHSQTGSEEKGSIQISREQRE